MRGGGASIPERPEALLALPGWLSCGTVGPGEVGGMALRCGRRSRLWGSLWERQGLQEERGGVE